MRKTIYLVLGRKQKIVGRGKKEREVKGPEHIIYDQAPGGGGCECCYTDEVLWAFPTHREAKRASEYPPYPYLKDNVRVIRATLKLN